MTERGNFYREVLELAKRGGMEPFLICGERAPEGGHLHILEIHDLCWEWRDRVAAVGFSTNRGLFRYYGLCPECRVVVLMVANSGLDEHGIVQTASRHARLSRDPL